MENSKRKLRILDILGLAVEINQLTDFYSFATYEGDTDEVSFEIYELIQDGYYEVFPILAIHGIGNHFSFDEAEEELSSFLIEKINRKGNNNDKRNE